MWLGPNISILFITNNYMYILWYYLCFIHLCKLVTIMSMFYLTTIDRWPLLFICRARGYPVSMLPSDPCTVLYFSDYNLFVSILCATKASSYRFPPLPLRPAFCSQVVQYIIIFRQFNSSIHSELLKALSRMSKLTTNTYCNI